MEEKYTLPQERSVPVSFHFFSLLGTLLLGFGMFAFFMPVKDIQPVFGGYAEMADQYALHLILSGSAFYVLNAILIAKRTMKAKRQR
ncbi:hypothetical protein QVZ43_04785 [Marinobacter sp. chi1]|uniref:Uncharacterized protein n=1 Tax=Marinobacter suaedae TaxID=3057675 RepID=A0ABT8VYH3_9GAMM|nr:hypothetical protein [Marinobacter sp. chi1]MDO3721026.1 hypothetical protein [Marinobacter sp. chi1]